MIEKGYRVEQHFESLNPAFGKALTLYQVAPITKSIHQYICHSFWDDTVYKELPC